MPAEQGRGLEDEERVFPLSDATGEEDEPEAIGWRETRFLSMAVQDDELLAQEGVLSDELGFTAGQVGGCGECQRVMSRLSDMEESPFENRKDLVAELAERFEWIRHVVRSLEKLSKAIKRLYPGFRPGQVAGASSFWLSQRQHSLKLADLTIEDARGYVASLQGRITNHEGHTFNRPVTDAEYSPQTIHSHVRILRTFSNWLVNEGHATKPVFERLELPKLPEVKIAVLAPEEIQQILASINAGTFLGARLIAMVLVMLNTGIRAGELVGMLLPNVDWDRRVIRWEQ